ncbi:MAG: AAA family ATPase [Acidocella sp.]|nr:AAA family ATPase [Acidocella sp.]
MKILELNVRGFRSLKDVIWKPGDLNVVIGPNGSGKSNLLRFLELVCIAAQGSLGKHIQSLGGMDPLLWDGKATEIEWRLDCSPVEQWRNPSRESLTYMTTLAQVGKSSRYRVEQEILGNYHRVKTGKKSAPFKLIDRQGQKAYIFDEKDLCLVAPEELLSEEETLLSMAKGPFGYNKLIPPYRREMAAWSVYQDLHVNQDSPIRQAVVARSEKRVDPDGQNLISVLHTLYTGDREFKQEINAAMNAAFGDDFEELVFPPAADQRIQLRVRWKSLKREQSAADLSDGTLRFLFLLTVLASPDAAPLIAIDEPETGLHPSMLPIVAEYAVDAAQRSQVILTTHSPQLLDAFKVNTTKTTVALRQDGQTVLNVLADEVLREWLKGYSLGALFKSGELESLA